MLRLRIQLGSALARLQTLADRLGEVETLSRSFGTLALPIVAAALERNFDEEGRPRRWPPLSPAYARWKERHFPGRRILERTGRLRRSIRAAIEGNAIVLSTDIPYAAAHQFGVPSRGLPARPFLVLTEDDRQQLISAIANALAAERVPSHESR